THVVHLWACTPPESEPDTPAELEGRLQRTGYSVLYLARALAAGFRTAVRLHVITAHGQDTGLPDEEPVHPERATPWAVARVVAREYDRIPCSGVDLDRDALESGRAVDFLLGEWSAPETTQDRELWVAYRAGQRRTRELAALEPPAESQHYPFPPGGIYLITGGQGGLGLELARRIAGHGPCRLVLLNRTPVPEDPDADRSRGIRDLEALGAEVWPAVGDVADPAGMAALVREVNAKWGPIQGVIHAAGVLSSGLVATLDQERFATVLRPKGLGTWVLDRVTRDQPLGFFVLCSSLAALISPAGLANYVAANAYQDGFAAQARRARGRAVTAIQWGPWGETGLLTRPELRGELNRPGVVPLTNEDGRRGLELALDRAQTAVVRLDRRVTLARLSGPLRAQETLTQPQATRAARKPWGAAPVSESDRELLLWLQARVVEEMAATLERDPEQISLDANFLELGLDSLMAVEIMAIIRAELGAELSPALLFDYPTIGEFTEYLVGEHGTALRGRLVTDSGRGSGAP
ncbi:MAG: SDR family NAD(P)-dependent oxidoreductase, partial [SAR202 cluster bacterium]|nr:SDR family NAD(P)-dependent oxidoreductase [SAR202 cluster bacterium]